MFFSEVYIAEEAWINRERGEIVEVAICKVKKARCKSESVVYFLQRNQIWAHKHHQGVSRNSLVSFSFWILLPLIAQDSKNSHLKRKLRALHGNCIYRIG